MLTALVLAPVAAALIVLAVPRRRHEIHLPLGLVLSLVPLALSVYLFFAFEPVAGMQFVVDVPWYEPWGVGWRLGMDGISMPMVLLTAILVPISLGASTTIKKRPRDFVALTLLLEAGMLGAFVATDLFLFFVFFEAMLIPMYFIIGVWGSDRRIYAALKFFLYTMFGSALMLAGIIGMAVMHSSQTGAPSFALADLAQLDLGIGTERLLFAAFALAFAVKVPLFPLHTWLPDAHTEAPTAGSVLLAGVLLKLGTYGLIRFNLTLFPDASVDAMWIMGTLAVIGIIYGAAVAIVQPDLKRLVAYSSVSHLGFIVLGTFALTSASLQGAVIQNVNHGLSTGALFLLVGMIYERRHTKQIDQLGGLQKSMPMLAGFFLFMSFASIGLPGLNGFIGEFLVVVGSFPSLPSLTVIAAVGVILAAVYLLWAYQRVFTGVPQGENALVPDLSAREIALLAPLAVLVLIIGIYPNVLLDRIGPSTDAALDMVTQATGFEPPAPGEFFGRGG